MDTLHDQMRSCLREEHQSSRTGNKEIFTSSPAIGKWKECEIDYCSMTSEDLKNDQQAWDATGKLIEVNATKSTRIVKIIFDKALEFFDMTRFPTTDKGVFGPLLRFQQALMAVQRRIIAAEEQLCKSLETIVATTPTSLERLRTQELMMRDFVLLVQRSRYLPKGDKEDYWSNQFIQHPNKATSSDGFPNPATRANMVDKMKALVQARRCGNTITLDSL